MKTVTKTGHRFVLRPIACALLVWLGLPAMAAEAVGTDQLQLPAQQHSSPMPQRIRETAPHFQAPAATGCASMPVFHEVPDPQPRPQQIAGGAGSMPKAYLHRSTAAPAAPSPMAASAVSVPEPMLTDVVVTGSRPDMAYRRSSEMVAPRQTPGPVTAGVVDDNADFGGYRAFLQRHPVSRELGRDISVRQRLQVKDAQGRAVPDAEVAVSAANGARTWARTDAGGQVWLHLNAFDDHDSARYRVEVRRDGKTVNAELRREQKNMLQVTLPAAAPAARARLDLVLMVDATGSMSDEIDKLRDSLQGIVREIGQLPSNPDICLGLVTYRDRGDDYFVRSWDLSSNVPAFQAVLDGVRAGGGGDNPEAMNEAFAHAVQQLSWRGPGTTRLLLTLADAPPHMDYGKPYYSDTMLAALGKGIKVLSVAASGQDTTGEIVQRQMAQYTGGRFIFLTYKDARDPSRGAGSETVHEVANYSVETLDALVVKLVREELAQLPKG